jgi:hypothetical protein
MNPVTYSQAIGEIISFGLWMRREGYRESTIQPCIRALKAIAKRANLTDTESVKAYLGSAQVSENRKDKLADDLARFYRYRHIPFDKPRGDSPVPPSGQEASTNGGGRLIGRDCTD